MRPCPVCKQRTAAGAGGFTMIELLVVVAIFAIMASLAAPSMGRLIGQQRLKSAASDLHLAMVKARAEAIKRNCTVRVARDGGWANGWTVTPVAPCPASTLGVELERRGPTSSVSVTTSATQVDYTGTGRPTAATAGATFVFSSSSANTSRCLAIDPTGRPYVKEGSSC